MQIIRKPRCKMLSKLSDKLLHLSQLFKITHTLSTEVKRELKLLHVTQDTQLTES